MFMKKMNDLIIAITKNTLKSIICAHDPVCREKPHYNFASKICIHYCSLYKVCINVFINKLFTNAL